MGILTRFKSDEKQAINYLAQALARRLFWMGLEYRD